MTAKNNPAAIALPIFAASVAGAFGLYRWHTRKAFVAWLQEGEYEEALIEESLETYAPWFSFAPTSAAQLAFLASRPGAKFEEASKKFEDAGTQAGYASDAMKATAKRVSELVAKGDMKGALAVAKKGGLTVNQALSMAKESTSSGLWSLTPWGDPGEPDYIEFGAPSSTTRHGWKHSE